MWIILFNFAWQTKNMVMKMHYSLRTRLCLMIVLLLSGQGLAAQEKYEFPEAVKPLIHTNWGQENPFNLLCPKVKKEDGKTGHMLAGCGPVAMAQIVNYHRYPSMSPDGKYTYDWNLMYRSAFQGLPKEQLVAVAKLISDCGVSSFTDYGEKGSSTSILLMMGALKRLLGYSNEMGVYERAKFDTPGRDSLFRQLIFSELKAGRPVIYRGYNKDKDKDAGHLFIIDGCNKRKVHVNWGWAGNRDGYYDLDDLDGYSRDQWLLVDVADSSYHAATKVVAVSQPGTLQTLLNPQEQLSTRHIRLSGRMDSCDFAVLRNMIQTGLLRTVNMEDVDMETLPDSAFFDCTYLSHLVAPRSLQAVGKFAFFRCRTLNYVVFGSKLRVVGNAAFSGCSNLLGVRFPETLMAIGHNAFTSCNALLNVTLPEGLVLVGNYAFSYCKHLYSVNLPKSLASFGKEVFKDCDRLTRVRLHPDNPNFTVVDKQLVPQKQ